MTQLSPQNLRQPSPMVCSITDCPCSSRYRRCMYPISISTHAPLLSYASLQVVVRIVKAEIPRELCLVEYLAAVIQALLLSLCIDDVVPDLSLPVSPICLISRLEFPASLLVLCTARIRNPSTVFHKTPIDVACLCYLSFDISLPFHTHIFFCIHVGSAVESPSISREHSVAKVYEGGLTTRCYKTVINVSA